ncbi:MAG: hypothetical protein NT002_11645 [candidate division Zixibacteria bacterium]|nr:hypothetical protein [candidate division Zixibacteria bacterium]
MTNRILVNSAILLLFLTFLVSITHGMQKPIKKQDPFAAPAQNAAKGTADKGGTGQSLGYVNYPSPAPGYKIGVTIHDNQHYGSMQRQVDWRGTQMVHFAWTKQTTTVMDELWQTGYEAYDAGLGIFLQEGSADSGGCDVHAGAPNNISGYVGLDVDTEGKAILCIDHTETGYAGDSKPTVWYDYAPGFCYFVPYRSKVPDSTTDYGNPGQYVYRWPSMEYQVWNGDTVTHVLAQWDNWHYLDPHLGSGYSGNMRISYFRRVGSDTVGHWEYPPKAIDTVSSISAVVTASRVSGKVALVWTAGYAEPPDDNSSPWRYPQYSDVYYMMSDNMGATWTPTVNVTKYNYVPDESGWLAETDLSALIDTDDQLHIIWNAREATPSLDGPVFNHFHGCRLFHWDNGNNVITTIKDANWDIPDSGCYGDVWNRMSIVKMQLSECDGKFYALFVQFNDIAHGIDNDCYRQMDEAAANGELYMSVSDNGGLNWDIARNLTNTYTPHCDTIGAVICGSEMWPSMSRFGMDKSGGDWTGIPIVDPSGSYIGNWYLDVLYVQDRYPGACVQDDGVWTYNPVKWFRLPCVAPVPNPRLECTPNEIGDPAWTKPSTPLDTTVRLENIGNAILHIFAVNIVKTTYPGQDWLGITGVPWTISHLVPNFVNATVNLNKGGAITSGPKVCEGFIEFVTDAPTSPDTLPVRLIVADTVQFPEWASIRTACNRIVLNNAGNLGRQGNQGGGAYDLDFFNDCDTTLNTNSQDDNAKIYLYDASPFILRAKGNNPGDTILNSYIFDADWLNKNGFRPGQALVVDSTSHADYQYAYTNQFLTSDSGMGIECEYWMPPHPDTCGFLIQRLKIVNKRGVAYSNLMIGELMDWDIPSDSGVENGSDYDATRQMMWCYGGEYGPDSITNNDCVPANNRAGGFAYLNGYKLPASSSADRFPNITCMYTGLNADWVYSTGNFVPQQLYNKLNTCSGYQPWQSTRPMMEDSLYQDLNMVAYYGKKNLGVNDTLIFIKILATEYNTGAAGLKTTIDKAEQWWRDRFNNAPIVQSKTFYGNKAQLMIGTVTGFDLDGDVITMTATGLPGTSIFADNGNGTGLFNWTPPDSGHFSFTVTANDGRDSGFATIYVVVTTSCCVKRGDANHDGRVNIQDVTCIINFLYKSVFCIPCKVAPGKYPEADLNCDCILNIQDVTGLIKVLYSGFPLSCPTCQEWEQKCMSK